MGYSNLAMVFRQSPYNDPRKSKTIDTIVIHHFAGTYGLDAYEDIVMGRRNRETSAHYAIDNDGHIGCYCDEKLRPWTTGAVDDHAITIELANDQVGGDWHVSDLVVERCIELCVDICKRNGLKMNYTGDKSGNLHMHCWHMATACPGPYLKSKFAYIADEVNKRLAGVEPQPKPSEQDALYKVQVGAFSNMGNAQKMQDQLKAKGYTSFIKKIGTLYKVQVGAYKVKTNAEAMLKKLKADGFTGFISSAEESTPIAKPLQVGDKVTVIKPINYDNGERIILWHPTYTIMELNGHRAVIGVNGVVTSAIDVDNLQRVQR